MEKEYCIVTINMGTGSAYEYGKDSEIPTKIKFGRIHNGKFQKRVFHGNFDNQKLHNIVYLIKRGYTVEEISYYLSK